MLHFYLGGARSGKSSQAETLAHQFEQEQGYEVIYIATGQALDSEMEKRIEHHQQSRPARWLTVEEPLALTAALKKHANENKVILVDCMTLWLSNHLHHRPDIFEQTKTELIETLKNLPGEVILVSNEVGQGIVPLGELSRQYVDQAGWLHQAIARVADKVRFVIAGIVQPLKG